MWKEEDILTTYPITNPHFEIVFIFLFFPDYEL